MRWLNIVLAFAVMVAVGEAAPFDPGASASYWHWLPPGEKTPAVVTVVSDQLIFVTACDSESYPVVSKAGHLTVHPAWARNARCKSGKTKATKTFESALRTARSAELLNGRLIFRDRTGAACLTLDSFDPPGLEYRRWHVKSYRRGGAMVTPLSEVVFTDGKLHTAPPVLVIFDDGGLSGGVGCGMLMGTYRKSRASLTLNASSLLLGLCPPEGEKQNHAILDVLKAIRSFKKSDTGIRLLGENGELLVDLVP